MATPVKTSRKGRKGRRKRSFFGLVGGCFGISKRPSSGRGHHRDGRLVGFWGNKSGRGSTVPVNDQSSTTTSSGVVEIHVVEEEEKSGLIVHETRDQEVKKIESHDKLIDRQNNKNQETGKLLHSISLPPLRQNEKKAAAVMSADTGAERRGKNEKDLIKAGELEPMFGAIIIMTALIMMLVWGRVCAILCTAAWLYLIPRFRKKVTGASSAAGGANGGDDVVDLDSWEYKKRVVLQGLLRRSRHVYRGV